MLVFTQGKQDNTNPTNCENDGEDTHSLVQKKYHKCGNVPVSDPKINSYLICLKGPKRQVHRNKTAEGINLQRNHPVKRDPKSLGYVLSSKTITSHVDIK